VPPVVTLNDKKTFLTFFAPQCGQAEGESLLPFSKCSNRRLHFAHSYSYMGIISVPVKVFFLQVFQPVFYHFDCLLPVKIFFGHEFAVGQYGICPEFSPMRANMPKWKD